MGLIPLLAASLALAAPVCMSGLWTSAAGGQAIFTLQLTNTPTGPRVIWTRPTHFLAEGDRFSGVRGPLLRVTAGSARLIDGDLEVSFTGPPPSAGVTRFRLGCGLTGHLIATLVGAGIEPFDFTRVPDARSPFKPWRPDRPYWRVVNWPTNTEMTQIFNADQADRPTPKINWAVVGPADAKRRQRTAQLLDAGALHSGDDFLHAAFILQHGATSDEFLRAHLLAMVAMARGQPAATWLAAATLDRYLQAIGRPRVLGTQFKVVSGQPATQAPYAREIASDALRQALNVPTLAQQDRQRLDYSEAAPAEQP